MLLKILFVLFGLFSIAFAFAYWREWQHRKKPYYKKTVRSWAKKLFPTSQPVFSVALLGDTGNVAIDGTDPVLNLLQNWLKNAKENSRVVFLGDNIYPKGLPPEEDRKHEASEKKLIAQLEIFKNYKGRVTYIGGNHDWDKGRKDGYAYILRQEEYIVNYLNDKEAFLPARSCPGPVAIQLAPGILMLVLNTQWFVQKGIRPIGKGYGCEQENPEDFFKQLEKLLKENQHQRILILGHHPLYSNALHGGKFTLKQHLFPLTAANKKAFIPFPVVGSIYPLYRQLFGAHEDMSHPRYKKLRKRLLNIFSHYRNLIYAAGHDHNLQYFCLKNNHYIVSGSGSKTTFVKKGGKATFAHEHKGFFVLDYFEHETWLRVLEPDSDNAAIEMFRYKL
jgi:predicted phosphodiesterase